jgi:hypothetical protein
MTSIESPKPDLSEESPSPLLAEWDTCGEPIC